MGGRLMTVMATGFVLLATFPAAVFGQIQNREVPQDRPSAQDPKQPTTGPIYDIVTLGLAADGPTLVQARGTEIPPAGERPRDSQDRPEGGRSPIYDHIMQADISLILDCLRVREIVQIWADGDMEERERASQELEQILQREYHRMVR